MGKGKKRDNKHHNTSNEEGSRSRQTNAKRTGNRPAQTNSLDRPKTTNPTTAPINDSNGKFSRRKIISNWDRYSEDDVSSKTTEDKVVQRLSQLLEQSVLQAAKSDFQPSLDALRDISTVDGEDIYSQAFDIDYDYLADCISTFPIHERLDLNPLYCKHIGSSSSVTEGSNDVTLEMYPLSSEANSSGASNSSEHISSVTSRVVTEKKQNKSRQDMVNVTPLVKDTIKTEDDDQLLTKLLATKTDKNNFVKGKLFNVMDHNKTTSPSDITDEENDSLLEELLAQPI